MFTQCVYSNRDGHRFFRDEAGRISIADQSGDTPEETDDGPLVVVPGSECMVNYQRQWGLSVSVPVTCTRSGTRSTVWLIPRDFSVLRTLVPVSVAQSEGFRKHLSQIEMIQSTVEI